MLPPLQRLPLAPRAPAEPTSAGEFGMAELLESFPRPYQSYEAPHPLTNELVANTHTLVPFDAAFHPPAPPPAALVAPMTVDAAAVLAFVERRQTALTAATACVVAFACVPTAGAWIRSRRDAIRDEKEARRRHH